MYSDGRTWNFTRFSNQQYTKMLALFFFFFFHPTDAQPPVSSLSFQCADAVSFRAERKCWPLATVAQKTIQVETVFFVTGGNFISFNTCWTSETWILMLCQNMVYHNPQKLIIQNTVLHKAYRVPQSHGLFTLCHTNHTQHNIMHMYPMPPILIAPQCITLVIPHTQHFPTTPHTMLHKVLAWDPECHTAHTKHQLFGSGSVTSEGPDMLRFKGLSSIKY